ncbi:MAG: hypothetical protein KatS3mg102_1687 [Planctomycetota bacterium]|nr:MAG: hypothetical protein KatS3mg102_1687 [Planctomycetota bacterium]
MIGLFGLLGGLFRRLLLLAVVLAALGGVLYYSHATSELPGEPGVLRSTGIVRMTPSLSGGPLLGLIPYTFETYTKLPEAHNWLLGPRGFGLVQARYEWSHAEQRWMPDLDFAARQADQVAARKSHAQGSIEDLLARLSDADPVVREVASKELRIRTGETHGYRYDAPESEREQAIARWRAWWQDPGNKARYGARRAVEVVDEVLEVLRRATGSDRDTSGTGR